MTVTHANTHASTRATAMTTWYEPDGVALRATLVLLPGRGESHEVYERFGRRLAADAYRVQVLRAPTGSAEGVRNQLENALTTADGSAPRVVIGSDAGAAYAAHAAANGRLDGASALILAGVPTAPQPAAVADWDTELDLRTACGSHRARISRAGVRPAELFTELPEAWLDPSIPSRISIPVLGIHGRDDKVSPLQAARHWYSDVPRAELVTVAGGRHDTLNDQTHRTVAATIVLFLERLRAGAALAPIALPAILRGVEA